VARGGRRQGKPGKAYPNRTDLNGPTTIPGQEYGAQAEQLRSQQAVPVQQAPGDLAALLAGAPRPDQVPSLLSEPSARPNEPLTAGLPTGPGPGPEALASPGMFGQRRPGLDELEALYQVFPFEGIRRLLEANARTR
jgi:hypothetical protein